MEQLSTEKTLQSIDNTLKRIETILLDQKNHLQALQDAVDVSVSQHQVPSKIEMSIDGKEFAKLAYQSIHGTCEVVQ